MQHFVIGKTTVPILLTLYAFVACDSTVVEDDPAATATLSPAFEEFSKDNVTVMLDDGEVLIETNGWPDHASPYWSNTSERSINGHRTPAASVDHPLYIEPTVTAFSRMSPGNIDDFRGTFSLTVPANPTRASSSTATGLGPIGIAVSGSVIYNDREGPNMPLDNAISSLDYTGAHTGPQSYHYHLEPKAWSEDDDKLIGVMSDGFFLYGRREPDGTHPADLDNSGGHTGPTPHNEEGEYHYHIQNELYLNQFYILFPGRYQGTPNAIR